MVNEFRSMYFVIRNKERLFVYGECEGTGSDFDMAMKFNDYDDAESFINHNRQYWNDNWKIKQVKCNYEIVE